MPRYKVLSEGETVCLGVEIVLESAKLPGQYLHTGNEIESSQEKPTYEVDLSVASSAFYVFRHQTFDAMQTNLIKVCRALHLKS